MKNIWTLELDVIAKNGVNNSRESFLKRNPNGFFIKVKGTTYALVSTLNPNDVFVLSPAIVVNQFETIAGHYLEITTENSKYFFWRE